MDALSLRLALGWLGLMGLAGPALVPAAGAEGAPASSPVSTRFGSVEGVITFPGAVPKSSRPDDAGHRRDLVRVDRQSRGLADVAVWLEVKRSGGNPADADDEAAQPMKPAIMDQFDHNFLPRVLAVRSGQSVKFTNSDPANHNVRTTARQSSNEFNVFTGQDGSYEHRFVSEPDQRPVRISCDIHPWMRGWIYVLDHPFVSVTDGQGRFRLDQVPVEIVPGHP
jgi:plastocyanin